MWISRCEYNELVRSKNFWEKAYEDRVITTQALLTTTGEKLRLMDEVKLQNSKLKLQVEEFKQKYADEVQKRLELIKFLENTP
jgi:hypothetical protein